MLPEGASVREGLPAEAAGVGPLAGVDSDVDLLTAPGAERFAAVAALEEATRRVPRAVNRQAVVHQRAAVGERRVALRARQHALAVRHHMSATEQQPSSASAPRFATKPAR